MSEYRFEGSVAELHYQGVGADTNTTYMGKFKFKCILSPMDLIKADRIYRELIGNINPHLASKEATNYAFALSQLKVRVLAYPHFFKNDEINGSHLDSNILIDLVNHSIDAQEEYKENLNDQLEKMQEMLANRIKKKQIVKEKEDGIEGTSEVSDKDSLDEDEGEGLPEIDLGNEVLGASDE